MWTVGEMGQQVNGRVRCECVGILHKYHQAFVYISSILSVALSNSCILYAQGTHVCQMSGISHQPRPRLRTQPHRASALARQRWAPRR